jgi:dihydroorotate dehydrogenase (NAD+) catalytic subunit
MTDGPVGDPAQGAVAPEMVDLSTTPEMVDLSTTVGSVRMPSPIMTAAGTAGFSAELGAYVDLTSLGAVVVKSLAHYPWAGNDPLRVHATPSGMINAVGLQGPGVEAWLRDDLPALQRAGARVVASIWGRTVEDYQLAAKALADAPDEVVAVEVNISCPNTEAGGAMFAHSPDMTARVIEAAAACERPRWAKLSPNAGPQLAEIAGAAAEAGAEAVTLVNTYLGLAVDPVTGQARLGNGGGGVSGPAIRPLAVRAVADVRAAHPDLPIIGVGGVAAVDDVVEFARVGAQAVQIGTATFAEPRTVGRLGTDLRDWCANQGRRRFVDLIPPARW